MQSRAQVKKITNSGRHLARFAEIGATTTISAYNRTPFRGVCVFTEQISCPALKLKREFHAFVFLF